MAAARSGHLLQRERFPLGRPRPRSIAAFQSSAVCYSRPAARRRPSFASPAAFVGGLRDGLSLLPAVARRSTNSRISRRTPAGARTGRCRGAWSPCVSWAWVVVGAAWCSWLLALALGRPLLVLLAAVWPVPAGTHGQGILRPRLAEGAAGPLHGSHMVIVPADRRSTSRPATGSGPTAPSRAGLAGSGRQLCRIMGHRDRPQDPRPG